jgi:hypothetical protein
MFIAGLQDTQAPYFLLQNGLEGVGKTTREVILFYLKIKFRKRPWW